MTNVEVTKYSIQMTNVQATKYSIQMTNVKESAFEEMTNVKELAFGESEVEHMSLGQPVARPV